MTADGTERPDDCWFLMCTREPAGDLYGDNGFAVAACEKHGIVGESFAWQLFERYDTGTDGGQADE